MQAKKRQAPEKNQRKKRKASNQDDKEDKKKKKVESQKTNMEENDFIIRKPKKLWYRQPWLSRHSQKLAIAFVLIHTSEGSPTRIVRNLKMCKYCHTYTKLISRIYERRIIIRDRNLFQHFEDGSCSCRDCW